MGFLSVLIHSYHAPRSIRSCILTAIVAISVAGACLLVVAMEGVICLDMAAPIALLLGIAGGVIVYLIQNTVWQQTKSAHLFCAAFVVIPTAMEVEHTVPPPLPLLKVQSSVIVDAPPEKVWKNVVAFSKLPPPTEAIFKLGVAYRSGGNSRQASGHPALQFPPARLSSRSKSGRASVAVKFSVTCFPEPMQEWTPYHHVHPPHLDGYLSPVAGGSLDSAGGQSHPVGGDDLVSSSTWPADYWQLWSDQIIHTIHRVLNHVKQLSEAK